jgi:Uma2 family endonuclease
MNAPPRNKRMTVDEFIPWARAQPKGRYELVHGEVVAMSPERSRHRQVKGTIFMALTAALQKRGIAGVVEPDGSTVRIGPDAAFEPDALLYLGDRLQPGSIEVPNPVIVVEVLSEGTAGVDSGRKFSGYFSLSSVVHYLIVDADLDVIAHHRRMPSGTIESSTVTTGVLRLDPPGLELTLTDIFSAR